MTICHFKLFLYFILILGFTACGKQSSDHSPSEQRLYAGKKVMTDETNANAEFEDDIEEEDIQASKPAVISGQYIACAFEEDATPDQIVQCWIDYYEQGAINKITVHKDGRIVEVENVRRSPDGKIILELPGGEVVILEQSEFIVNIYKNEASDESGEEEASE